ncbi:hypothetical protein PC121_g21440, partial [Phytophthora cactorum]
PHDQGFDHNLADDAASDAEATSTLVFASGDESENNTPAGPATQSSVIQGVEASEAPVATDAGSSRDEFSVQADTADTVDHTAVVAGSTPYPYNTKLAPCNPGFPLFVPTGQTREIVGRQIQVKPVLTSSEIATDWDVDFRVPPAAPAAPVRAGDSAPVAEESSTIDDADLLRFFARVATVPEPGQASGVSTS